MPWPDFSELSFGFAFLREFERHHAPGCAFPSAPDFISQRAEALAGYDVEVALDGSNPFFLQFKRSFVLTTRRALEIQNGDFTAPVLYRMELRKKDNYRQHLALQNLEQTENSVFYVTSQIQDFDRLTEAYLNGDILGRTAALFSPIEINLPDLTDSHHLSFRAEDDHAFIYSREGYRLKRRYPRWEMAVETALLPGRRSAEENRKNLAKVADQLSSQNPRAATLANRFEHPAIKASVLAFLVLDAQLTLFRQ